MYSRRHLIVALPAVVASLSMRAVRGAEPPLAGSIPMKQLDDFYARLAPRLSRPLANWVAAQATILLVRKAVDLQELLGKAVKKLQQEGVAPEGAKVLAVLAIIQAAQRCDCLRDDRIDPKQAAECQKTWSIVKALVLIVVAVVVAVIAVVTSAAAFGAAAEIFPIVQRRIADQLEVKIEDLLAWFDVRVLVTSAKKPVAGARVSVRIRGYSERTPVTGVTGSDGVATFENLYPNFYVASVEHPSCESTSVEFSVRDEATVVNASIGCAAS